MDSVFESALSHFVATGEDKLFLHYSHDDGETWGKKKWLNGLNHPVPEILQVLKEECKGQRVLDVGAGLGSYALELQDICELTAVDISPTACGYMVDKGVDFVICQDIMEHAQHYDVAICMMNNIGMTGDSYKLIDRLNRIADAIIYDKRGSLVKHEGLMYHKYEFEGRFSEGHYWDYRPQGGEFLINKPNIKLKLIS